MGPRVVSALRWRAHQGWTAGRNRCFGVRRRLPEVGLAPGAADDKGAADGPGRSAGPVALTFDDGPHPRFTPAVLDVLGRLGVPATFFCVGDRALEHPDLVRRLLAEGHQLGIHCGTHQDLWTIDRARLGADVQRGRDVLEDIAGRRLTLFRPAKGHMDVRVGLVARRLGLRTWLWDVDPEDWRPGATSTAIAMGGATAGPGGVILLHDGLEQPWAPEALDRSATVAALEPMVGALRARGLDLVGLPA